MNGVVRLCSVADSRCGWKWKKVRCVLFGGGDMFVYFHSAWNGKRVECCVLCTHL